jgi:hypothetical protein
MKPTPAPGPERELAPAVDRCDTHGVPTDIYFSGENVRVTVDEDPSQVAEAFTSAHGLPFRVTGQGRQGDVYINPLTVAFWSVAEPSPEPEPREEPEPTASRDTVTDIWGKPLRRKPRR